MRRMLGGALAVGGMVGGGVWAATLIVGSLGVGPVAGMTVSELTARRLEWMWAHGMPECVLVTASVLALGVMVLGSSR